MFHPSFQSFSRVGLPLLAALAFFLSSCSQEEEARPAHPAATSTRSSARTTGSGPIGVNVLLKTPATSAVLAELSTYGAVTEVLPEINAVVLKSNGSSLEAIRQLAYVQAVGADAERKIDPVDADAVADLSGGVSTWNLDALNVTDLEKGRVINADATGVYVGVLDTGLQDNWRQYFPQERIASQYAKSFWGGDKGTVAEQPNKWEHDQHGHGTHVTSTIIGYNMNGIAVNGVAPKATIIPVKVLSQTGASWSSIIARGILYIAGLKEGPLKNAPVIINMSLGGSVPDPVEKAAVDYAMSKGVIVVCAAGNSGTSGMSYPAAFPSVISVASAAWQKGGLEPNWWFTADVEEPINLNDFTVSAFSGRALPGQDLDVTAPGSRIFGPFQTNSGSVAYASRSGTSMATPHVAGIVALMAQRKPSLQQQETEYLLEAAALDMAPAGKDNASGAGFITADKALTQVQ